MFAKILHANDGSDRAFKALSAAIDLAKRCGSELHMICDGHPLRAAANIAASLMLCFAGVWVGHAAAAALNG